MKKYIFYLICLLISDTVCHSVHQNCGHGLALSGTGSNQREKTTSALKNWIKILQKKTGFGSGLVVKLQLIIFLFKYVKIILVEIGRFFHNSVGPLFWCIYINIKKKPVRWQQILKNFVTESRCPDPDLSYISNRIRNSAVYVIV